MKKKNYRHKLSTKFHLFFLPVFEKSEKYITEIIVCGMLMRNSLAFLRNWKHYFFASRSSGVLLLHLTVLYENLMNQFLKFFYIK